MATTIIYEGRDGESTEYYLGRGEDVKIENNWVSVFSDDSTEFERAIPRERIIEVRG